MSTGHPWLTPDRATKRQLSTGGERIRNPRRRPPSDLESLDIAGRCWLLNFLHQRPNDTPFAPHRLSARMLRMT
jgi:hypothetical protein